MHDQATPSQPATTETVVTRAVCATIGALGLAAAIGLSSGGHDLLGAALGVAAAAGVIAVDTLARRRRNRRTAWVDLGPVTEARFSTSLGDPGDFTSFSDRSDDLSIPPFAPLPHGADTRGPAPSGPPPAGPRTPLLPADLKAPVFALPPLVQAGLLILAEADRDPTDQDTVRIPVSLVGRLRRAVSAEIEVQAGATAAYSRAAKLKAMT